MPGTLLFPGGKKMRRARSLPSRSYESSGRGKRQPIKAIQQDYAVTITGAASHGIQREEN